ncbi:hypothetical protein D3C86_1577350 [compost metagenome]
MRHGVVGQDAGLRGAVDAHVVGQVAAGAQHDVDGGADIGARELLGHHVIPGRAGARHDHRAAAEAAFGGQLARHGHGALQEGADVGLVLEHAFVDFHAGQGERIGPARQRVHHGLLLGGVTHAGTAALHAQFHQYLELLATRAEERA